jgi:hypothetical protein
VVTAMVVVTMVVWCVCDKGGGRVVDDVIMVWWWCDGVFVSCCQALLTRGIPATRISYAYRYY